MGTTFNDVLDMLADGIENKILGLKQDIENIVKNFTIILDVENALLLACPSFFKIMEAKKKYESVRSQLPDEIQCNCSHASTYDCQCTDQYKDDLNTADKLREEFNKSFEFNYHILIIELKDEYNKWFENLFCPTLKTSFPQNMALMLLR